MQITDRARSARAVVASLLLAGSSSLALVAQPALAQESTGQQEAPAAESGDEPGTLIVTGTRIARPELESTMPIAILTREDARDFGRNTVYDALMLNPAIGPGLGESSSLGQEYDAGVANINLRNMGNNRSLVLVDGHRWVSGGARTSAVDVNTIPSALIERFEVVTGGAAAIYGADAVTGAVNIIMKKEMKGLHLSATTGISGQGDAGQSDLSAAGGFDFGGGRGHLVFGANYSNTAPLRSTDRWHDRNSYYANPANTGPNDGIPDNILARDYRVMYRSATPAFCMFNGKVPCGSNNGQWYQLIDGVVTAVPKSSYTLVTNGETGGQDGGAGLNGNENHFIRNASQRASFYSNLSYELTPAITWNTTFAYTHTYTRGPTEFPEYRTDARTPPNWWGKDGVGNTGEVATLTNPYLPDSLRQFMIANKLTSIGLDRSYMNLPLAYEIHERDNFTIGTDVGGALSAGLNWQAFVRYGQVIDNITTTNMVGRDQWLNARDTVRDGSGQIVCANATARANGCQPLNFFSTDPFSPALLDYLLFDRYERTKNSLLTGGASLDGSVFSLPYGDVSIAVGAEWRRETLHTQDDPDTAKLSTIIFSPGMDFALHPALGKSRDTSEAYGEIVVPLLRDLPFAQRLEIEGAYRYSHYSDNPDTHTWKAGGAWEPVRGFTVRGTYSHSVRVPNFGELYSPIGSSTYGKIDDPCSGAFVNQAPNRLANCKALMPNLAIPLPYPNQNIPVVYTGGNPDLTPETSNSWTVGAVFQPNFLPGFDVTADYWDINIENAVTALGYLTILQLCVADASGPTAAYCDLVTRNADGTVGTVRSQNANLAALHGRGIDVGARYRTPVAGGQFRVSFNGTYLLEQTTVASIGVTGSDAAGGWSNPRFKGTLMTSFDLGQFSIGLNTRFISRSKYSTTAASDETYEYPYIPAYVYNDLNITVRPTEDYSLTFGVKNISNNGVSPAIQDTAITPHGTGNGRGIGPAYYDAIGRYLFVKVDAKF
ncbi:MAG: TonB-dependent receptor [Sphingomonas sp.]|uniref:TonB-dependent receptor domain-containing protein n=1 Tax=Sphingomonas sp. TaxID=28214 RepID=UPI001B16AF71|nr:TonB-dependent receptor [Sphingomonas sp.]MBO9624260.1 TonB-dependent receptor [Sphingomonas sp.]